MSAGTRVVGVWKWLVVSAIGGCCFSGCSDAASSDGKAAGGAGSQASSCHANRDPAPHVPASTALDPHTVALAAAVYGACVPDDGVVRNAAYMWSGEASNGKTYYRTQLQLDCLAHSACGCAALEHCLGYAVSNSSQCQAGCVEDVFTACGGGDQDLPAGTKASFDCKSLALRCDPVATCLDGAPLACDGSFTPSCNAGGQTEYCERGLVRHGPTCAEFGLDCSAKGCVGRGASCSESSPSSETVHWLGLSCSGTTLSACVGGKLASVDCSSRGPGFACQHVADDYFCGLAAECDPPNNSGTATAARCSGTTLEFCNAGRLEHIDCSTLGFTGCDLSADGHYGCIPGLTL